MFALTQQLLEDPKRFLELSLFRIPALLLALVLHECAHGYAAYRLGDPTAKNLGRLTLNPLPHLDPVGAILLFVAGFGWAKPVPVNPNNFKNPFRDDLIVSVAGVTVNFILFFFTTILAAAVTRYLWVPDILKHYSLTELMGVRSDILAMIQYGYASEFTEYFARPWLVPALRLLTQISLINLCLCLFNLLPVPPLDGSHVWNDLFFKGSLFASRMIARIGGLALLALSFTGWLGTGIGWAAGGVQGALLRALEGLGL